jgi:hypothetical protein
MAYGGTRNYKLYTWGPGLHRVRSFKTRDAVMDAYLDTSIRDKHRTDVWLEYNKQTPKEFIIKSGRYTKGES